MKIPGRATHRFNNDTCSGYTQARAEPADTDMILGALIFTKWMKMTLKHLELVQSWSCASGSQCPPLCFLPWLCSIFVLVCVCARVCAGVASVSRSGAFSPISSPPMPVSSSLRAHLSFMSYAAEFKSRVLAMLSLSINSWYVVFY